MPTPIIVHTPSYVPSSQTKINPSSIPKMIIDDEGNIFNLSFINYGGLYFSSGKYWIWFHFPSSGDKYYYPGFNTKEEALINLREILRKFE